MGGRRKKGRDKNRKDGQGKGLRVRARKGQIEETDAGGRSDESCWRRKMRNGKQKTINTEGTKGKE